MDIAISGNYTIHYNKARSWYSSLPNH